MTNGLRAKREKVGIYEHIVDTLTNQIHGY